MCGLSVDEGQFSPVGFAVLARKAITIYREVLTLLFVSARLKKETLSPSSNKSQTWALALLMRRA